MKTEHQIIFSDSKSMKNVPDESIDLVVTSPPYPMIEMWDRIFAKQNPKIGKTLKKNDGAVAFEFMHRELDRVWDQTYRVLKRGGIVCVNIGDATRTIGDNFALYPNHSRILNHFLKIGLSSLPAIIWRKQTNAPNKFMGSGMLAPGAYVTLEHEYILILRKGGKREFNSPEEKSLRRESAFFWEERNAWFSDIWFDLKGTTQDLNNDKMRKRSAAYPFELPYRLINMFSIKNDTVLDPFFGLGTTTLAAMTAGRNSIGYEIDETFREAIQLKTNTLIQTSNQRIRDRIKNHLDFVKTRFEEKGAFKYINRHYQFPVMTNQEKDLLINKVSSVEQVEKNMFEVHYSMKPQKEFHDNWDDFFISREKKPSTSNRKPKQIESIPIQLKL
jgi:modification methylase